MKPEPTRLTLSVELDEAIYFCLQDFLAAHPDWNQTQIIDASLSLFFLQNHATIKPEDYHACSQKYLHSVCAVPPDRYFSTQTLI